MFPPKPQQVSQTKGSPNGASQKSGFPPDLPPVSNRLLYVCRVLAKWLSFFVFGLGTPIMVVLIFPVVRLFFRPMERFQIYGRRLVSFLLSGFVSFMRIVGIAKLETGNREDFRRLSSKIIVANHPSLLDPIILISLLPNADTIVSSKHNNVILRGLIRQLYILSSLDFENILAASVESLKKGNCLIIFPEGTRTPRSGEIVIKKGAARIALASGCGIIPLHIGGNDKFGLGKKDPWFSANPQERYIYDINIGPEINPEKHRALPKPRAVQALTKEISASLFPEKTGSRIIHQSGNNEEI